MSSIQGVSSATASSALQVQKLATPVVAPDKDHDGDADKASAIDKDKGKNINLTA